MGGLLILASISISTLLWADLHNFYLWVVFLVTLSYGLIGFIDDFLKVTRHSSRGFSGKLKLLCELVIAAIAVYVIIVLGALARKMHRRVLSHQLQRLFLRISL